MFCEIFLIVVMRIKESEIIVLKKQKNFRFEITTSFCNLNIAS